MTPFGNFISLKRPKKPKEEPELLAPSPRTESVVSVSENPSQDKMTDRGLECMAKAMWYQPGKAAFFAKLASEGGYFSDLSAAAERLYRHWPREKGVLAYGTLLMKGNQLDAAEAVFREHIAAHGEKDSVLINLAEVYSARGDQQKVIETLWRALEVNPNGNEGLGWYERLHCEQGGAEAGLEALRRVAVLGGSWRAQLWLAKHALERRRLDEALAIYRECLARIAKPYPADLLVQMSGDLGNAGLLPEILQLVEPHFDERRHGLELGNNLMRMHLDLGQMDAARRVLDRLYALKIPRWKKSLGLWDREIVKGELAAWNPMERSAAKMVILTSDGPVWMGPMAAELFPAKSADALVVGFLGGSAEPGTNSKRVEFSFSEERGRMSDALPLFFAEQVEFHSRARVRTLAPWHCVENACSAVIAATKTWKDEDAATFARQGETKCDYVVVSHLKTQVTPWTVELRLVRTIDGKCLGSLSGEFPFHGRQEEMPELAQRLLGLLVEHAEVERQPAPSLYQIPKGMEFSRYLHRLDYLMALRCRGIKSLQSFFLCGARDVIDALMERCGAEPENVCARILLAETLLGVKVAQPNVVQEFQEGIEKLQKEKPLAEPAQGVVQRMVEKALGK